MRSTWSFVAALGAALMMSALLGACSTDDSTLNDTFSCTGGGTTLRCIATSQYCERASDGSRAVCLALPSGCGANPCSDCLASGTNGIIQCDSIAIGSTRATTATVRR